MTDADVIIVGGGMLGSVTARELRSSASGLRILVIEAGPETVESQDGWRAVRSAADSSLFVPGRQYTGVGGRGGAWGGVVHEFSPQQLTHAMRDSSYSKQIQSLYSAALAIGNKRTGRSAPELELLGYKPTVMLVGEDGQPFNPAEHVPDSVQILPRTRVDRIVETPVGLGVTVTSPNGSRLLRATNVVLAAGTIENLALLDDCSPQKAGFVVSDHIVAGYCAHVRADNLSESMLGVDVFLPASEDDRFYTMFQTRRADPPSMVEVDVWGMIDLPLDHGLDCTSTGSVTNVRPRGQTKATIERLTSRLLQTCQQRSRDLQSERLVPRLSFEPTSLRAPARYTADLVAKPGAWFPYVHLPGTVQHEYGYTALSLRRSQVEGQAGLWVLGGATMRSLGPYNPTFTYIAQAILVARDIGSGLSGMAAS